MDWPVCRPYQCVAVSEHDHALHDLSLQVKASVEDFENKTNASQDSTNSQPDFKKSL